MEDCKVSHSHASITNRNKKPKKQRKKRIVKNTFVDVDSVTVQPGIDYGTWIQITKQKLKERERKLFQITITKIESIVNKEINHKTNPRAHSELMFTFPHQVSEDTLTQMFLKIDGWKGVQTSRVKSGIACYKDYWKLAKNWYIQMKRKLFGDLFWVRVFETVHNSVAVDDDHQRISIEIKIIRALFDEKVTYNHTKPVALINGGTVIHSNALHQHLSKLHHSLQIKQWIKEQEMCGNWRKKAEAIGMQIQSQLEIIIESNAYAYADLNSSSRKTISIKTEPMHIQILGMPTPSYPIQQNNNNNNNKIMPLPPPIMQHHNDNNNNNNADYASVCIPSYRVANSRHSPMGIVPKLPMDFLDLQTGSKANLNKF